MVALSSAAAMEANRHHRARQPRVLGCWPGAGNPRLGRCHLLLRVLSVLLLAGVVLAQAAPQSSPSQKPAAPSAQRPAPPRPLPPRAQGPGAAAAEAGPELPDST